MGRKLSELDTEFRTKVSKLLQNCREEGYTMTPYFTNRDPYEQAILWRQSRTTSQIEDAVNYMRKNSADFLADCLEMVGPRAGKKVTNALPGLSWHQWGLAVDCFWQIKGEANWSARKKINGKNGYRVYTELALQLDLTPGGSWVSIKDWVHVQDRAETTPLKTSNWKAIDEEMIERWGNVEFK